MRGVRAPEEVRQRVWELLQARAPWRAIRQLTGASNDLISSVSLEGGRPLQPTLTTPAPRPASAQVEDGMTEFLPPAEPAQASAPEQPEQGAPPAPEQGSGPLRSSPAERSGAEPQEAMERSGASERSGAAQRSAPERSRPGAPRRTPSRSRRETGLLYTPPHEPGTLWACDECRFAFVSGPDPPRVCPFCGALA